MTGPAQSSRCPDYWAPYAGVLAPAYARSADPIRFELVTRALAGLLPPRPQRIVDVGGGFGEQAILLARAGHEVVIVDPDPMMLGMARDRIEAGGDSEVAGRIVLVAGDGLDAARLAGTGFDAACCHSVLMYRADPAPMLATLVGLVRPGGLISILDLNPECAAMRPGLQRRWREAAETILHGQAVDARCLPSAEHRRGDIEAGLIGLGADPVAWFGVGIFTDHLSAPVGAAELEQIAALEWLAGSRDPYRAIARCYHLVARKRPAARAP